MVGKGGEMSVGILILIIGMVTLFSIQNVTPVSVSVLFWQFDTTLPLLFCVAVLLGVIVEQLIRQLATKRGAKAGKP